MIDVRRLGRLAAAQWAEKRRAWSWFLLVGIGVHGCVLLLVGSGTLGFASYDLNAQAAIYVMGLLTTAALFAGRYFESLSTPGPALTLLMRPGSGTEKWLLALLVVGVAYPLAYTAAFQVFNIPATLAAEAADAADRARQARDVSGIPPSSRDYGIWIPFLHDGDRAADGYLLLGMLALQGFMVCATLYFRRLAVLKGFVALFVVLLLALLVGSVADTRLDVLFSVHDADADAAQGLGGARRTWLAFAWFGVPALCWLGAWQLLRERELR